MTVEEHDLTTLGWSYKAIVSCSRGIALNRSSAAWRITVAERGASFREPICCGALLGSFRQTIHDDVPQFGQEWLKPSIPIPNGRPRRCLGVHDCGYGLQAISIRRLTCKHAVSECSQSPNIDCRRRVLRVFDHFGSHIW